MKRMNAEERHYLIRRFLNESDKLYVCDLADRFNVTEKTIREDIKVLEQKNLVSRFHGGISKLFDDGNPILPDGLESEYLNDKYDDHFYLNDSSKNKYEVVVIGAFNVDINVSISTFPKVGETILSDNSHYSIGGKAVNQAIAIARNGGHVVLVNKVGLDQFNEYAKRFLNKEENIFPVTFETAESPTGHGLIIKRDDGEKQIIVNPGANGRLLASEVKSIEEKIANSNYVSLQLECSFDSVKEAITIAKKYDKKIILNPTPYNQNILDLLDGVYILTINKSEAESITGINIINDDTAKESMRIIAGMGVINIILTMGDQGAICFTGNMFTKIPAYRSVCVDKSGVGDAFNGALIAKLIEDYEIVHAADYACAYAALSTERKGASNMPQGSLTIIKLKQREKRIIYEI